MIFFGYIVQTQYDEPYLNKSCKARPKIPTASNVIPLGSRITIVWNPTTRAYNTYGKNLKQQLFTNKVDQSALVPL